MLWLVFFFISQVCVNSMSVTIVGSGAAGLTAAIEASKNGDVLVIEKTMRGGGNSAKASSGINGAETHVQKDLLISDDVDTFIEDTVRVGQEIGDEQLVSKLCLESNEAIRFLVEDLQLPLTDVIQLGGHSNARTHRLGTHAPIGWTMIQALRSKLEQSPHVRFEYGAEVTELITEEEGNMRVIKGVTYQNSAQEEITHLSDSVVLATGGMAHSTAEDGLFAEFAPELSGLATSSGNQADGKGMAIARQVGAELVGMKHIQLHPTGLVNPKEPDALSKILGPETLRGVGGILLLKNGKRFVNELARRGHVAGEIRAMGDVLGHLESGREQRTAHVVLNEEAMNAFSPKLFNFYVGKGIFKAYSNAQELCSAEGIDCAEIAKTFTTYASNAEGIPDEFGKVHFPVKFTMSEPLWTAQITPVIHYTMGGIKVNTQTEVIGSNGLVMQNLFAAGECTGGVHGGDRLAGNSLLECVVMGRAAGKSATTPTLKSTTQKTEL